MTVSSIDRFTEVEVVLEVLGLTAAVLELEEVPRYPRLEGLEVAPSEAAVALIVPLAR